MCVYILIQKCIYIERQVKIRISKELYEAYRKIWLTLNLLWLIKKWGTIGQPEGSLKNWTSNLNYYGLLSIGWDPMGLVDPMLPWRTSNGLLKGAVKKCKQPYTC